MTRYVIKKYVDASSLEEALKKEKNVRPEDAWKDEKQPDEGSKPDQIGFRTDGSDYYYSPYMKKNAKKRKKKTAK